MDQLDQVNEDIRRIQILIDSGMACQGELDRLASLRDALTKGKVK